MSSYKKVAVVLPNLCPGGAEKLHVDLSWEWRKHGITTDFWLRSFSGDLIPSLPDTSSVFDLKSPRVRHVFFPLVSYLREQKPDAVIAAMWPLTVIVPLAAKYAGFKGRVIVSEHSPLSLAYSKKGNLHRLMMKLSQRFCYPLSDVVVAVSSGVSRDLSQLSGIAASEFTVIHNPAAKGRVNFEVVRPALLQDISGPLVLSVGTLKKVKRYDLLIEAFSKLPRDLNATLVIVGEGAERIELEKLAERLNISNKVLMPGYVDEPGPWYAHADVFALSSEYEGFGNVIVEALEYGLPVVSTDCPFGPSEILDCGKYGTLVTCNDSDALSAGIRMALSKRPDPELLLQRAKDFDIGVIAERYLDVMFPDRP